MRGQDGEGDARSAPEMPTVVEWLKTQLKEFQDQNTYQPPCKDN